MCLLSVSPCRNSHLCDESCFTGDAVPLAVVSARDVPLVLPPRPVGAVVQGDEGLLLNVRLRNWSEMRGKLDKSDDGGGHTAQLLPTGWQGRWKVVRKLQEVSSTIPCHITSACASF